MRAEKSRATAENSFVGGSELGALLRDSFGDALRSHNWSQTPLGAVETWSDDLKAAVQILLTELERAKPPEKTQRDAQEQKDGSASAALHQANQLNAFPVKLADALRPLTDASEIQAIAARILGESLGATRVIYIEVVSDGEEVIVHCNYTNGVAQLSGRYRWEDYRCNLTADHQAGRTQVVTDIPNHLNYTDAQKTKYREIDIAAHIDVPLIKNNQFVALLAVQQSTPRQWTETEVKLVEETAERTWAAVERAYAEAALCESEAKYRGLFESLGEGYFLADVIFDENDQPIDIFYLETNPAAIRMVGQDFTGRRLREIDPNSEAYWYEIFGRVAQTGMGERLEQYAEQNQKWYDFYVFKVGDKNSRRVSVVFKDITQRKRREANAAFLAEIGEDFSQLSTADEIMQTVGAKIGAYLRVTTCNFTDVDEAQDQVTVHHGWSSPEVPSTVGTFRTSQYLSKEFERASRAGETVVICNTQTDPRTDATGYAALNMHSFVTVPFHRNGRWTHYIAICDSYPRDWHEDEIQLIEEISNRIFPRLERARAESALRESEEKYRSLFESMNDGFCIIELIYNEQQQPIDYRFLETNPAFERQSGLSDPIGKTGLYFAPNHDPELLAHYQQALVTGEPIEFEIGMADLGRHYRISVNRHGDLQKKQLAIVFNNISERQQAEVALRESEERFRLMADSVPQIVWITDSEGRVEFFNKQWSDYTGVPYEPTTAAEVAANFVHPEDGARTMQAFNEARRSGGVFSVEHRIRSAAGTYRWFLVRAEPYRDPQTGKIIRWFGASVDIHDRKQAEEALRKREQRLSIATEAAQLGIFEWKVPEDITIWENDQQYEIFGLTPADGSVSAQEFFENYLHPDDASALTAKLTEAMQTGILCQTSYRIRRQDGTTRWLEVNGQFEYATDGSPVRFIGVNADITDRKQAEAIITTDLENTRLLRDLSAQLITEDNIQVLYDEIMAAAITLTRADAGTVQILDKATQELLLLASQGFDRTMTNHFYRVNASSNTSCGIALITGTRTCVDFDVPECDDPSGALRMHVNAGYLSAQSTPLISRSGRPIGMVSTHWRKHHRPTERELRFLDLLARQAADLIEQRQTEVERKQILEREQAAREEAERANRIKDEFLAVLSHELRSPLNPILGWTRLLQNRKLDEARRAEALKTIERNAKLQTQLIEDLLDISRIMQGKLSLTAAPVSLAFVISAAIETVRLAAEAKHIRLQLDLDNTVAPISGDAARLQQVVWNLLSNAVKFTPNGGQVTVELRQLNQLAQIRVIDTGKGINPQFLPYVFEYFRQEDGSTTRKFGGLGLGLAIARQIVQMHGGTVRAESQGEGQGATFIVQLPTIKQKASIVSEPVQTQTDAGLPLEGIQILLVDDEPDTREFQAFLLEQNGAKVTAVASGLEALEALEQSIPDVLVSDIGMADMDGYMLLQQIRSREASRSDSRSLQHGGMIPAIALTAYAAEIDRQQALQVGFQTHITKPVEPEVLVRAIALSLGRA